MTTKKRPAYRAYTVEDIDEDNSFWTLVGTAFPHEDRQGMNILLKALPVDGRLVLRRYTESKSDMATVVPLAMSEDADANT